MTGEFSLKNLYLVDPGWRLHVEFYAKGHEHLLPGGECWFIELQGAPRERFEEMIAANPRLEYLGHYALGSSGTNCRATTGWAAA